MRDTRTRILLVLGHAPRALEVVEIAQTMSGSYGVSFHETRTLLADLAHAGICERADRVVPDPRGRFWRPWECYRLNGAAQPWPGEPAAATSAAAPIPIAVVTIPLTAAEREEEEDILAAAALVADEDGFLNLGPLREAVGWGARRSHRVITRLRRRGAWPYRWRYARFMAPELAARRLAAASAYKRSVGGRSITSVEFDMIFGE